MLSMKQAIEYGFGENEEETKLDRIRKKMSIVNEYVQVYTALYDRLSYNARFIAPTQR